MKSVFENVRYVVFIAVVGLLLAGIAALLFGGVMTVSIILEIFRRAEFNTEAARLLSTDLIELIDLYLLGTVLLITAIGLYQLFINSHIVLPEWLSVTNLEQLKFNLLAVIVVMLAILFLSAAASAPPAATGFLAYGAAVALVLAAIAGVVWVFDRVLRSMEELKHQELTQQEQQRDLGSQSG